MPDFHEDPETHDVEMSPQHLVNATWKATTLSLLAVVVALVIVLAYVFIGVDAMRKGVDDIKASNAQFAAELRQDHLQLVCRDVASYQEDRAVSDTIVVFLVALQNLAADTPIDVEGLGQAIRNLRAVQGERDSLINNCLNGSTSQVDPLRSPGNG
jgi:hypothetical protein